MLKLRPNCIFSPWGLKISHGGTESKTGCAFKFEDINPSCEFTNVLNRKDRLQLAWFFLRSTFITRRPKA